MTADPGHHLVDRYLRALGDEDADVDGAGRIAELRIVYETVEVRPAYEAAGGHRSYRAP